jgi:hypothetical protein
MMVRATAEGAAAAAGVAGAAGDVMSCRPAAA